MQRVLLLKLMHHLLLHLLHLLLHLLLYRVLVPNLLLQLRLPLLGLLSDFLFPFFHLRLRRVSRDVINIAMENM